jgi:hypothetical protein
MRLLKKIAPIAISALMIAATAGSAMAVGVNQWKSTVSDPVIVLSSMEPASTYDIMAALNVANSVGVSSGTTGSTSATVSGNAASLNTASEKIYFEVDTGIGVAIDTLTDDELPTVLGADSMTDDAGTEYSYVQTIKLGNTEFTLSDSSGDLDNPALLLDVGISATDPLYNYTLTMTNILNWTDDDSIGEDIELGGMSFTIGTNTDVDTIHLFGGADTVSLDTATTPSTTVTIGGTTYTVTLDAVSEGGTEASITLSDGSSTDTETISEGSSKKLLGVTVYVKDTMSTTNDQGRATVLLGANEIYLEDTSEVMVGSDQEDIDNTRVWYGASTTPRNLASLTISVAMQDNDLDHIAVGDKFVDPVFGTFYVQFSDAVNGPMIDGNQGDDLNTARHMVEFTAAKDDCVQVTFAVGDDTKSIEFDDDGSMEDCSDHDIEIVEGAALSVGEYTILNSGSDQMMVEVTKIHCDAGGADDDITLTDVFTGEKYELKDVDFGDDGDTQDLVINGQTFTVHCLGAACVNGIAVVSSDFGSTGADTYSTGLPIWPGATPNAATTISVYPYLKPLDGLDHVIAFVDDVNLTQYVGNTTYWNVSDGTTSGFRVILPTGYFDLNITENTGTGSVISADCDVSITVDGGSTNIAAGEDIDAANNATEGYKFGAYDISVGEMDYLLILEEKASTEDDCVIKQILLYPDSDLTAGGADTGSTKAYAIGNLTASSVDMITQPSVLFVEEEDNSDSDVKNILLVPTEAATTYEQVDYANVTFSGGHASSDVAFDDSDFSANVDAFGTYYVKDSSDDHAEFLWFTYPEEQMYADVYFAESDAMITAGAGGFVAGGWKYIKDTEVTSFSNRNLVVVGGTAVNRVARKMLGMTEGTPVYGSEDAWQTATNVDGPNKAILKLMASPYASDKYALLVAGWEGSETEAAANWLTTGTLPTADTVLYDTVNKVVIS